MYIGTLGRKYILFYTIGVHGPFGSYMVLQPKAFHAGDVVGLAPGRQCLDSILRRTCSAARDSGCLGSRCEIWVVVKMMVPLWVPIIIRHLGF